MATHAYPVHQIAQIVIRTMIVKIVFADFIEERIHKDVWQHVPMDNLKMKLRWRVNFATRIVIHVPVLGKLNVQNVKKDRITFTENVVKKLAPRDILLI